MLDWLIVSINLVSCHLAMNSVATTSQSQSSSPYQVGNVTSSVIMKSMNGSSHLLNQNKQLNEPTNMHLNLVTFNHESLCSLPSSHSIGSLKLKFNIITRMQSIHLGKCIKS